MFAPWIPEALSKIEALGQRKHPAAPLAVSAARRELVNCSPHLPAPTVEPWETADGVGVRIGWAEGAVRVWPDGRVMQCL
jgi:hypothetical protein